MKRALAILAVALPGWALAIEVPSGQEITLIDVIEGVEGTAEATRRYRFLAPGIAREGGNVSIDAALEDIDALCRDVVLPDLAEAGAAPDQVVISLSDRVVEFGVAAPDATQFFEAYRIENGECIWEGF